MALLERRWTSPTSKDEAASWTATIVQAQTVDSHTVSIEMDGLMDFLAIYERAKAAKCLLCPSKEYSLEVLEESFKWTVARRYSDFRALHQGIEAIINNNLDLNFPKKKMTGSLGQ